MQVRQPLGNLLSGYGVSGCVRTSQALRMAPPAAWTTPLRRFAGGLVKRCGAKREGSTRARPVRNRPPGAASLEREASARSPCPAEAGCGDAQHPRSSGPRPSRRGAPPDSRSRQSARRPAQGRGMKIGHDPSGAASRGSRSCVRASAGQLGGTPGVSQVRAILQAANIVRWASRMSGSERCPGWERSDRSGTSLEALPGAHHRVVSVSVECRVRSVAPEGDKPPSG